MQYAYKLVFSPKIVFLHFYHTLLLQRHSLIATQLISSLSRRYKRVRLYLHCYDQPRLQIVLPITNTYEIVTVFSYNVSKQSDTFLEQFDSEEESLRFLVIIRNSTKLITQ
jgi:hypothetical protein